MEIYIDGSQTPENELYVSMVGFKKLEKIFAYVSYVPLRGDNMTAEQVALLMALELIKDRYLDEKIILYSDQIFYVDIMNSGQLKTKHFGTHEYISYIYELFNSCKGNLDLRYIKRSRNRADKLFAQYHKRCVDIYNKGEYSLNPYLVTVLKKAESYKYKNIINLGIQKKSDIINLKKYRIKSGKLIFSKSS